MNDADLQLVLASYKQRHPQMIDHLRAFTAQKDTPLAAAASALLQHVLVLHDEGEQLRWSFRDLLQKQKKLDSGFYWALRYRATDMIHRIAICGEADPAGSTYYDTSPPPEIANWKQEPTP